MKGKRSATRGCFLVLIPLAILVAVMPDVELRGQASATQPIQLVGKMVCIGASITAGEGVKPAESYVGLLKAKVKAEHLDLQVIGQGRSGWSTGAFLDNADKVVAAMPADTTIITMLLGINDSRENGSPQEVGARAGVKLGKLIDLYQAKAPKAQFVILSPTRPFPEILTKRLRDANYGENTVVNLKEIDKAFESIANARGFVFVDLSQVPSTVRYSIDGIHLTAEGHREIFEAIWRSLTAAGPSTQP